MTTLYYFRSSQPGLHGFSDEQSGSKLPPEQGPWRLVRAVMPVEGWTGAADISAVRAGIVENGFFLVDREGELSFDEMPVKPAD